MLARGHSVTQSTARRSGSRFRVVHGRPMGLKIDVSTLGLFQTLWGPNEMRGGTSGCSADVWYALGETSLFSNVATAKGAQGRGPPRAAAPGPREAGAGELWALGVAKQAHARVGETKLSIIQLHLLEMTHK